jgi:hypothetical protein
MTLGLLFVGEGDGSAERCSEAYFPSGFKIFTNSA